MVDNDVKSTAKKTPQKLGNKTAGSGASTPAKQVGSAASGATGTAKSAVNKTPANKATGAASNATNTAKTTAGSATKPARSAIGSKKPIQATPEPSRKKQ